MSGLPARAAEPAPAPRPAGAAARVPAARDALDPVDRAIVLATQGGLPLVPRPWHAVAAALGIAPAEVMRRVEAMQARGAVRRIAAVPNHYAIGWRANGMSVWDVDDAHVSACGREVGALGFVSHCYRRPRREGLWRYNLFAMVHGRDRAEVADKVTRIAAIIGPRGRAHDVLYSTRILKKTGLRLAPESRSPGVEPCSG